MSIIVNLVSKPVPVSVIGSLGTWKNQNDKMIVLIHSAISGHVILRPVYILDATYRTHLFQVMGILCVTTLSLEKLTYLFFAIW